ncbi:MAG TPA: GtrA family protein [Actinophytocola sp.]|jgi:putative flippase GtrA|nr:GtrA family protein [Actinophytocola sp.]
MGEVVRFLVVGAVCNATTTVLNYALKYTVLTGRPVTALTIAVLVATAFSYVLSREWSFRTRGGRERHHEVVLFLVISGIGVALNAAPLYVSRYVLGLAEPRVGLVTQEVADFVSGIVIGSLVAMVFRFWALRKWVFPQADARSPAPGPRAGTTWDEPGEAGRAA